MAVPVKVRDYLECDEPLRGQSHVCLSFITPEDVLDDKNAFFASKFIKTIGEDITNMFTALKERYPQDVELIDQIKEGHSYLSDPVAIQEQYRSFIKSPALEEEFHASQDFRTTIRGVKVRGAFGSKQEAAARADKLRKLDPNHHIYVADVGAWLPFQNVDDDDQVDNEYAETALNTLMKKYKENQEQSREHFNSRVVNARAANKSAQVEEVTPEQTASDLLLEASKEDAWTASRRISSA
jgi:hypothetical protein